MPRYEIDLFQGDPAPPGADPATWPKPDRLPSPPAISDDHLDGALRTFRSQLRAAHPIVHTVAVSGTQEAPRLYAVVGREAPKSPTSLPRTTASTGHRIALRRAPRPR
jgi:hypothetical protein